MQPPKLNERLKPIISVAAIAVFALNAYLKHDAESLGWCLLCVLWAL